MPKVGAKRSEGLGFTRLREHLALRPLRGARFATHVESSAVHVHLLLLRRLGALVLAEDRPFPEVVVRRLCRQYQIGEVSGRASIGRDQDRLLKLVRHSESCGLTGQLEMERRCDCEAQRDLFCICTE